MAKKLTTSRAEDLRLLAEKSIYEFKGVKYALVMTHRVTIEWEELTGFCFFADAWRIFEKPSLKALSAFAYCLMSRAGFEGDRDEVAEHLMQKGNMRPALDAVSTAYIASQVPKEDMVAGPPAPMRQ